MNANFLSPLSLSLSLSLSALLVNFITYYVGPSLVLPIKFVIYLVRSVGVIAVSKCGEDLVVCLFILCFLCHLQRKIGHSVFSVGSDILIYFSLFVLLYMCSSVCLPANA
jgi:hypothetical protein